MNEQALNFRFYLKLAGYHYAYDVITGVLD